VWPDDKDIVCTVNHAEDVVVTPPTTPPTTTPTTPPTTTPTKVQQAVGVVVTLIKHLVTLVYNALTR